MASFGAGFAETFVKNVALRSVLIPTVVGAPPSLASGVYQRGGRLGGSHFDILEGGLREGQLIKCQHKARHHLNQNASLA